MFLPHLFLVLSLPLHVFAQAPMILSVGQSRTVPAASRVWVENGKIIRVSDEGSRFRIRGVKAGKSMIRIGDKESEIYVLSNEQHRSYELLKKTLPRTLGLDLAVSQGQVTVTGKMMRVQDWRMLYEACASIQCSYEMRAFIKDSQAQEFSQFVKKLAKEEGLSTLNLVGRAPFRGFISRRGSEKERAKSFYRKLGIIPVESSSALELAPLVRVKITIAEIKKNSQLTYGLNWTNSVSGQLLPKFIGPRNILFNAHMLEQEGFGKILASPNILCRSGKEAEFFAGGEFPIKIFNRTMQDVIWKKYGIMMKVKPLADESGRMSISIETEVSSIDSAHSSDGVPGVFTNRVQSHFDLTESRVIALSGLIKSEEGKSNQGLPGLSQIPVLGALFGSKDFRNNQSELVIFVHPEIIDESNLENL